MQPINQLGAFTYADAQIINALLLSSLGATTGNIYYLNPANGSDGNDGLSPYQVGSSGPVKTLSAGYNLMASGNNDVLVLIGNGTTTGTARISSTFTWSKNAAHLIGACAPSMFGQRARISNPTSGTAFANFFVVSGAGCLFQNLEFIQTFATGTTAEIGMTLTGQRSVFINCQIAGMVDAAGAADAGSRHLKISSGENYFGHCVIGEDTITRTNANASIEFTSGAARNVFEDCIFPANVGSGGAPVMVLTAGAASLDRFTYFRRCVFTNFGTAMTAGITLAANSGGYLLLDFCTQTGQTAIADSTSKSQVYLNGPAPNGGAGVAVVVT